MWLKEKKIHTNCIPNLWLLLLLLCIWQFKIKLRFAFWTVIRSVFHILWPKIKAHQWDPCHRLDSLNKQANISNEYLKVSTYFITFSMNPNLTFITTDLIWKEHNKSLQELKLLLMREIWNAFSSRADQLTQLPPSVWCQIFLHIPQYCFDFNS